MLFHVRQGDEPAWVCKVWILGLDFDERSDSRSHSLHELKDIHHVLVGEADDFDGKIIKLVQQTEEVSIYRGKKVNPK